MGAEIELKPLAYSHRQHVSAHLVEGDIVEVRCNMSPSSEELCVHKEFEQNSSPGISAKMIPSERASQGEQNGTNFSMGNHR